MLHFMFCFAKCCSLYCTLNGPNSHISKSIETENIYMYADDTLIECKSKNIDTVATKVQEANVQLVYANKLSINLS